MKRLLSPLVLLVLLLAGGCVSMTLNQSRSAQKDGIHEDGIHKDDIHEDDIREAVFRYLMSPTHFGSRSHQVYFLALVKDKDPSDELIKRFVGHEPPVKKVSQSHWDPKPLGNIDQ